MAFPLVCGTTCVYYIMAEYTKMELDRRGGNGVDNENTGHRNEYETIQDPDEGYRHTADPEAIYYTLPEPSTASTGPRDTSDPGAIYTLPKPSTPSTGPRDTADPGAIYTLPEPSTASTGPRDTADPGAIYTLPGPSTASTGPRHTADPGAIYTLPEPSTASTGPRDSADPGAIYTLPEPSTASTGPRDTADPGAIYTLPKPSTPIHKQRRCAYILVPGISMIILAGILGYIVWKVSKQNDQIMELTDDILVMKEERVLPVRPGMYL